MADCFCPEPIIDEIPEFDGIPSVVCAKCGGTNPKISEDKPKKKKVKK